MGGTWIGPGRSISDNHQKKKKKNPDKPVVSKNGQVTLSGERMQGLKRRGFLNPPSESWSVRTGDFLLQPSHYTKKREIQRE